MPPSRSRNPRSYWDRMASSGCCYARGLLSSPRWLWLLAAWPICDFLRLLAFCLRLLATAAQSMLSAPSATVLDPNGAGGRQFASSFAPQPQGQVQAPNGPNASFHHPGEWMRLYSCGLKGERRELAQTHPSIIRVSACALLGDAPGEREALLLLGPEGGTLGVGLPCQCGTCMPPTVGVLLGVLLVQCGASLGTLIVAMRNVVAALVRRQHASTPQSPRAERRHRLVRVALDTQRARE